MDDLKDEVSSDIDSEDLPEDKKEELKEIERLVGEYNDVYKMLNPKRPMQQESEPAIRQRYIDLRNQLHNKAIKLNNQAHQLLKRHKVLKQEVSQIRLKYQESEQYTSDDSKKLTILIKEINKCDKEGNIIHKLFSPLREIKNREKFTASSSIYKIIVNPRNLLNKVMELLNIISDPKVTDTIDEKRLTSMIVETVSLIILDTADSINRGVFSIKNINVLTHAILVVIYFIISRLIIHDKGIGLLFGFVYLINIVLYVLIKFLTGDRIDNTKILIMIISILLPIMYDKENVTKWVA